MVRKFCFALLVFLSLSAPNAAHADSLDNVLQILWTAGMIDKGVVDAKPLVSCLIQGNSVQTCGEQFAGQAASDITATDPKVKLVVDIILAAQKKEWLTVLEIAGTDLLAQIACNAGIPVGGPVKSFICSGVFVEVAKKSKPVVRQVLIAVDTQALDDWLKVAAMTGPSFACEIMPSIPGKDMICSTLAQVLGDAAEAVADAADAVYGSAAAFGEWISGQTQHMPTEQYYNLYWKPWYHYGVILQLRNPGGWGDLLKEIRDPCEDYFDSHTMSQDNAQDTCDSMRNRFSNEVTTFRKAIELGPNAYLHAVMEPLVEAWVITDHGGNFSTDAHKNFIINGCAADLRAKFPFPEPDPNRCTYIRNQLQQFGGMFAQMADTLYNKCVSDQARQLPDPTAAEYLCKSLDAGFDNFYKVDKMILEQRLMNLVSTGACAFPPGWTGPGVELNCSSIRGYEKCLEVLQAANPEDRCSLPKQVIAEEVITKVGGNRCRHNVNAGRIECARSWKWEKCEEVLADYRNMLPGVANDLQCTYIENPRFLQEVAKAQEIIAALNGDPVPEADEPAAETGGAQHNGDGPQLSVLKPVEFSAKPSTLQAQLHIINCATTWDPLAIHCNQPDVLFELSERLPGATLPPCKPDPFQDGADAPCYSGAYPINMPENDAQTIPMPDPDKLSLAEDKQPGKPAVRLSEDHAAGLQSVESGPGALTLGLPDYQIAEPLTVSGKQVSQGETVELEAGELEPGLGSRCLVDIHYTLKNPTATTAPPPTVQWSVSGQIPVAKSLGIRINPNGSRDGDITLTIPSGVSTLTITADPANQVKELNEGNNTATLTLLVNGTCASALPNRPSLAPIQHTDAQPKGLTLALPDYQVADSLVVANKQTNWSGIVDLASSELSQGPDPTCAVKVVYAVNNNSPANAPETTTVRWTRPGKPPLIQPLGGFKAHGQREQFALFYVPSGLNALALTIDPENKVKELNENNNTATLTIRINGPCGTTVPQQTSPKLEPMPTLQQVQPVKKIQPESPAATPAGSAPSLTVPTIGAQPQAAAKVLPDYRADDSLLVAGKPAKWSGVVNLEARELKPGAGSSCEVPVHYAVDNKSPVNSSASTKVLWTVPGKPPLAKALGPITANGKRDDDVALPLAAGLNTVTLAIDPENRVAESDEGNNKTTLTIRLNGSCGTTLPLQTSPQLKPGPAPTIQKKSLKPMP